MGENRGPQLIGVNSFLLAFSWVFVSMRCYCRIFIVKSFGLDDYFCLVAQLLFTLYCGFSLTCAVYGAGRPSADIQPPSNIPIILKWWWAGEPVYILSNMMLKLSIGAFLLRLVISKVQRVIIWFVMGVSAVVCAFCFFIIMFQCRPITYFWTQFNGGEGSCINPNILTASTYAYSAMSCWSDWTYCILPTFLVWNLQINSRSKVSICVILGVGAIASAFTIIRIPYLHNLEGSSDFLYAATDVTFWSTAETGLAISACASTTLRPLFRRFSSQLFATSKGSSEGCHSTWPSARAGYMRDGRSNYHRDEENMWVQTKKGTTMDRNDAIYLTSWTGDNDRDSAGADGLSNSSQAKLKADEENGPSPADSPSGILKTVAVSTYSTRI